MKSSGITLYGHARCTQTQQMYQSPLTTHNQAPFVVRNQLLEVTKGIHQAQLRQPKRRTDSSAFRDPHRLAHQFKMICLRKFRILSLSLPEQARKYFPIAHLYKTPSINLTLKSKPSTPPKQKQQIHTNTVYSTHIAAGICKVMVMTLAARQQKETQFPCGERAGMTL